MTATERLSRLTQALTDHIDPQNHAGRMSGLLDDLDVGLVSVHSMRNFAHVNGAAARLLNIAAGNTTAAEFAAVMKRLAQRAVNKAAIAAEAGALELDPAADYKAVWVFPESPTHLGVVSKTAPYPRFDGRIWAFYDNSPVAAAIESATNADALLRASSEAMMDPQAVLEAVWLDGRAVDLIHRDVNRAACDYLGLRRRDLVNHPITESQPEIEDTGLLAMLLRCVETGEPVVLNDVPHYSAVSEAPRYYDFRGARVRPGVMALTWREVTERVEQAQRIAASENRLASELSGAARYVASIMPGALDGPVEVTSRHLAAGELSGDSFGYRWVDDDHLQFYVVDVSGHGMAPAMVSVSVHNLLRSATFDREKLLEPAAVLTELNRLFQMEGHGGNYFTIWYGVYQASTRLLRFASAGHPPAIVLSPNASPTQLATKSLPVGLLDDTEFGTAEYEVPPETDIVVCSDGAFDVASPNGTPWSQPEFVDLCGRTAQSDDWTLDSLLDGVNAVSGGEPFGDDCTLVRLSFP